jgi:adenylyltransferase/sulfurtransferase
VLHGTDDIGRPKVESAAEAVADLNPDVDVQPHETRVTADNVEDLIADYDLVVDGSDNFETRFLINDACTLAGIPFTHGAVFRFEGQVTTFAADEDAPCYRCLFPEAPPEGTVPNCATAGVLGVLPGTVGCLQATETVKCLLGKGESLSGRLVAFDAMDMTFEEVPVRKNPDCPVCGPDGIDSVHEVEYTETCAIGAD